MSLTPTLPLLALIFSLVTSPTNIEDLQVDSVINAKASVETMSVERVRDGYNLWMMQDGKKQGPMRVRKGDRAGQWKLFVMPKKAIVVDLKGLRPKHTFTRKPKQSFQSKLGALTIVRKTDAQYTFMKDAPHNDTVYVLRWKKPVAPKTTKRRAAPTRPKSAPGRPR